MKIEIPESVRILRSIVMIGAGGGGSEAYSSQPGYGSNPTGESRSGEGGESKRGTTEDVIEYLKSHPNASMSEAQEAVGITFTSTPSTGAETPLTGMGNKAVPDSDQTNVPLGYTRVGGVMMSNLALATQGEETPTPLGQSTLKTLGELGKGRLATADELIEIQLQANRDVNLPVALDSVEEKDGQPFFGVPIVDTQGKAIEQLPGEDWKTYVARATKIALGGSSVLTATPTASDLKKDSWWIKTGATFLDLVSKFGLIPIVIGAEGYKLEDDGSVTWSDKYGSYKLSADGKTLTQNGTPFYVSYDAEGKAAGFCSGAECIAKTQGVDGAQQFLKEQRGVPPPEIVKTVEAPVKEPEPFVAPRMSDEPMMDEQPMEADKEVVVQPEVPVEVPEETPPEPSKGTVPEPEPELPVIQPIAPPPTPSTDYVYINGVPYSKVALSMTPEWGLPQPVATTPLATTPSGRAEQGTNITVADLSKVYGDNPLRWPLELRQTLGTETVVSAISALNTGQGDVTTGLSVPMAASDYRGLPSKLQKLLIEGKYDLYNQAIEETRKKAEELAAKLEPYKTDDNKYKIMDALYDGQVSEADLLSVNFDAVEVGKVMTVVEILRSIGRVIGTDAKEALYSGQLLYKAIEAGVDDATLSKIYSQTEVDNAKEYVSVIKVLDANYKGKDGYNIRQYAIDEREKGRSPEAIYISLITVFDPERNNPEGAKAVAEATTTLVPEWLPTDSALSKMNTFELQDYAKAHPEDIRIGYIGGGSEWNPKTAIVSWSTWEGASKVKGAMKESIWKGFEAAGLERQQELSRLTAKISEKAQDASPLARAIATVSILGPWVGPAGVVAYLMNPKEGDEVVQGAIKTIASVNQKVSEWNPLSQEKIDEWVAADKVKREADAKMLGLKPEAIVAVDNATKQFWGGLGRTAIDLAKFFPSMGMTILGTELKLSQAQYQEAAQEIANVTGSLVLFPVLASSQISGKAASGNIFGAAGEVAGFALGMVVGPKEVIRGVKGLKNALDPRVQTAESLMISPNIFIDTPGFLVTPETARMMAADAAAQMVDRAPANAVLKSGRDIVTVSPDGLITVRETGFQKAYGIAEHHATGNPSVEFLNQLRTNKEQGRNYVILDNEGFGPGDRYFPTGGIYTSPQTAAQFLGGPEPAYITVIRSTRDTKMLSPEAKSKMEWENLQGAKDVIADLEARGLIEHGAYPSPKWVVGTLRPEIETWWPNGTRWNAIPDKDIPIYAKKDVTAVTYIESDRTIFEEADPAKLTREGFVEQDGKWVNAEGKAWEPKVLVKEGDKIPNYWFITDKALEDGLRMPSLAQMYKAEILSALISIRKNSPWNRRLRREALPEETVTTSKRFGTALETVKVKEGAPSFLDEYVNEKGEIQFVRQGIPRESIGPEPTILQNEGWPQIGAGWMRSGVDVIPIRKDGKIGMVHSVDDKAPNTVFSSPGGAIDVLEYGNTFQKNAAAQLWTEAGLRADPDRMVFLGINEGKRAEYSLPGNRVYMSDVGEQTISPTRGSDPKIGPPEIDTSLWWDGKSKITVMPAQYDYLARIANNYTELVKSFPNLVKPDMTKVTIYTGKGTPNEPYMKLLMESRDKQFAKRTKTEADVRKAAQERAVERAILEKAPIPFAALKTTLDLVRGEVGGIRLAEEAILKEIDRRTGIEAKKQGVDKLSGEAAAKEYERIAAEKKTEVLREAREIGDLPYRPDPKTIPEYLRPLFAIPEYERPVLSEQLSEPYISLYEAPATERPAIYAPEVSERGIAPKEVAGTYKEQTYSPLVAEPQPYVAPYDKPYGGKYGEKPYKPEKPYGTTAGGTRIPPYEPPPVPPYRSTTKVPPIVPASKYGLTPSQIQGAIAWKQGWVYKMLYPPFGPKDILNTKSPIEGVRYHEGPRAAYDSIVRKGGYVPPVLNRNMGIMDIRIETPESTYDQKGNPELNFALDRNEAKYEQRGPREPKEEEKVAELETKIDELVQELRIMKQPKRKVRYVAPTQYQSTVSQINI